MMPVVSIRVITYNHGRYIAQCLESLVMQRTDFPFEIIVGEDCSTDNTLEIVMRYRERYPDLLTVITSETNVGAYNNTIRVAQACRGKYHAYCEGDDFWIDPLKLQKQVSLMEAHPEYAACCHDVIGVWEEGEKRCVYYAPTHDGDVVSLAAVMQATVAMPISGMMVRASVIDSLPAWRSEVWAPDLVLRMWCAHQGGIGYLPGAMSIYRLHGAGATAKTSPRQKLLDSLHTFTRFDEETSFQYTAHLRQAMCNARHSYLVYRLRRLMGGWFDLLSPRQIARRLRKWWS